MDKSGSNLYRKDFVDKYDDLHASVLSGHMFAVQTILQKITEKQDITVIKRDDRTVIIYPGEYTYGIVICKENLYSLQRLIARFVYKIEAIYSNVLKDWRGDLEIFKPIKQIFNEVFLFNKKK